ncbi:MAG: IPT/TIG domain-containing protein [Terriglobales bacterium]|jgi:glucose/arabinose dehydrogenase
MSLSDKLLGKKTVNGKPHIEAITPACALPGGEVRITGKDLRPPEFRRPSVRFGDVEGSVLISSDDFVVARVPEGAASGPIVIGTNGHVSNAHTIQVAAPIADNLHPVTNPAFDRDGNLFVTFSGSRGEKVPVAIFKIGRDHTASPFLNDMMNATAIAFDRGGQMYVSSRHDEAVYQVSPDGAVSTYAEGMGVATGIAFDRDENLFVGDRSGTIFKIARDRQIFVFATLEPSISAYHLAIGPHGDLFVTGPTTSSFDSVYKVDPHGSVSVFYRGLGRPQGMAFDIDGNLYVAASLAGKRGIVKITPQGKASLAVAGNGLVGLAFAPNNSAILATSFSGPPPTGAVHHIAWGIEGLSLPPV